MQIHWDYFSINVLFLSLPLSFLTAVSQSVQGNAFHKEDKLRVESAVKYLVNVPSRCFILSLDSSPGLVTSGDHREDRQKHMIVWKHTRGLSSNFLVRFLANGMPSCGQEMPPNTILVPKRSYESKSDITSPPPPTPTHLQDLSLSSSWRALQSASEFLQEHWQVRGFWMNNRFLLAKQPSQHGSHWL